MVLVGGFKHDFYFPFHIWDVILPIDELIFFKMVKTTNQYYIIIQIYPPPQKYNIHIYYTDIPSLVLQIHMLLLTCTFQIFTSKLVLGQKLEDPFLTQIFFIVPDSATKNLKALLMKSQLVGG